MSNNALITFKAGRCNAAGRKVTPQSTPGYLYLYSEDDLIHLCWRSRSAPASDPELDLITIPGDASFTPLVKEPGADDVRSPTNGRVFVLKFSSSGEKQYFWMQSKSLNGVDEFSQRDQRLGQIVDAMLSGEDVDVEAEVEDMRRQRRGGGDSGGSGAGGDEDDLMELDRHESRTGGAGADATGGDPTDEGGASREGGADGGRAPQDTSALVQNFLNSLNSGNTNTSQASAQQQQQQPYTTLPDLLPTTVTVPYINAPTTNPAQVNALCALLPPDLFLLAQESTSTTAPTTPSPAAVAAGIEALSDVQKRDILVRVLRSPQLQQSLGSLTVALRDGGLPMIGDALGLKIENGGAIKGGTVPLAGGEAVKGFVEGVKRTVEEEDEEEK